MMFNEGKIDRALRTVIGMALMLAWLTGWVSSALALVLGIVGGILVVTGLVGFCPIYAVLGLSTRPAKRT